MARTEALPPPQPAMPPPPPPATLADNLPVKAIALSAIAESPTNPRKTYDKDKLQRLADSIRETTLIQPIIIRPWPASRKPKKGIEWECIVGSRRLRAHHIAGLDTILSRVVDLTDNQVIELQLIENAQREDVHPLEEGETYMKLLKFDGYSPELLAQRTGHPVAYVHQRLAFTKLHEKLQAAFYAERIHIGHATLLANLKPELQLEILDKHMTREAWNPKTGKRESYTITVIELQAIVKTEYMLQLNHAPWKLKDATLVPDAGSCIACGKRTGAAPGLFEEFEMGKADRCLDRSCFERKSTAHLQSMLAIAEQSGEALIQISHSTFLPKTFEGGDVIPAKDYGEVPKAKGCPHAERAIYAEGAVGRQTLVCRAVLPPRKRCENCTFHVSPDALAKTGDLWADRAKALPEKINFNARKAVFRSLLKEIPDSAGPLPHGLLQMIAETVVNQANYETVECLALEYIDIDQIRGNSGAREALKKYIVAEPDTPAGRDLLRIMVASALAHYVHEYGGAVELKRLIAATGYYNVDGAAIAQEVQTRMQADFDRRRAAAKAKAKKRAKAKNA